MKEDLKFIRLTVNEKEIAVNIKNVIMVKSYGEGKARLKFIDGSGINVKETYDEVVACLNTIKPSEIN
ncbi:MAG: hypothetical protein WC914_08680 [Proteiniphilum sp.]